MKLSLVISKKKFYCPKMTMDWNIILLIWRHYQCFKIIFLTMVKAKKRTCPRWLLFDRVGHNQPNVQGVPRFSYELAGVFWRFPNEFAMIRMRYQCKIVEVRNRPVQGRIGWQYGWWRHHSLGYLPSPIFKF